MPAFDIQRLRPYRPNDLAAVLAFAGECNARTGGCGYLHPGDVAHLMSNTLRGRDLERHTHLYEDGDGALLALALIYPARHNGFDWLVHPDARGGELERGLITWCEQATWTAMQEVSDAQPTVGCEVMDCDAIRRDLLVERGYSAAGQPSMLYTTRSLDGPIPAAALPDGFGIRSVAGEQEVDAVCAVHNGSFTPNKWTHDEYLAVMRTPGFAIDRELVVVAPGGRFAAFLIYWLDPISRSGLFEPVGCHRDFQRRGLTKALMYEGMRRMVAAGMRSAIVNHHADNPVAVALYRSVGFQTTHAITDFRKPMR